MGTFWAALKKGNTTSATAALGNAGLAIAKGLAASYSGSGAMFASAMHSVADAINQGFVFIGSVLGEKKPMTQAPMQKTPAVSQRQQGSSYQETVSSSSVILLSSSSLSTFWIQTRVMR